MADYIYTNGELYSTSELKHWKYIKREWDPLNDRWRYTYDDIRSRSYEAMETARKEYMLTPNTPENKAKLDDAHKRYVAAENKYRQNNTLQARREARAAEAVASYMDKASKDWATFKSKYAIDQPLDKHPELVQAIVRGGRKEYERKQRIVKALAKYLKKTQEG